MTGTRHVVGGTRMAIRGSSAPTVNASADDSAACHGFVSSPGVMPSSISACAEKASRRELLGDGARGAARQPLAFVERGQLVEFGVGVLPELSAFLAQ